MSKPTVVHWDNIFARHAARVRMAKIAQMINVLQAMIMTDKEYGADASV